MKQELNFKLFPDIKYQETTYSSFDEDEESVFSFDNIPLIRVFNESKSKRILLIGEGSIGKSTSMHILADELTFDDVPCKLVECKYITDNAIEALKEKASCADLIFLFDGFDETRLKIRKKLAEFIGDISVNHKVVVSSRFDFRECLEGDYGYSDFEIGEVQRFDDKQLNEILGNIKMPPRLKSLIKNTMMLSMYLQMKDVYGKALYNENINEALFIKKYFELLLNSKDCDSTAKSVLADIGACALGEQKADSKLIPYALNSIFYIRTLEDEAFIDSSQIKLWNFAVAIYLREKLVTMANYLSTQMLKDIFAINDYFLAEHNEFDNADRFFGPFYNRSMDRYFGSIMFVGELITELDPKLQKMIISKVEVSIEETDEIAFKTLLMGYYNRRLDERALKYMMTDEEIFGSNVLNGCELLESIRLPDKIKTIGDFAFWGFNRLEEIVFPNSLEEIGNDAFWMCKLNRIDFNEGLKRIGSHAFDDCFQLERIVLPKDLMVIEDYAFSGCSAKEVFFEKNITKIGAYAFSYCSSLKKVHIESLKEWCQIEFGNYFSPPFSTDPKLFVDGKAVKRLVLKDIKKVNCYAFYGCSSIEAIEIVEDGTEIQDLAFVKCKNLKNVIIKAKNVRIGEMAFSDTEATIHCDGGDFEWVKRIPPRLADKK